MISTQNICDDQKWGYILIWTLIYYTICLGVSILWEMVQSFRRKRMRPQCMKNSSKESIHIGYSSLLHKNVDKMRQGITTYGKVLVVVVFLANFSYLLLYFYKAVYEETREHCVPFSSNYNRQLDLLFACIFTCDCLSRLLASKNMIWFMLSHETLVDFFTICPSIISIYLDRFWVGAGVLRVMKITMWPHILTYFNLFSQSHEELWIKLLVVATVSISWPLTATGVIYIIENIESAHPDIEDQALDWFHAWSLINSVMSTVGFGYVVPKTMAGMMFISLIIITTIFSFARNITMIGNIIHSLNEIGARFVKDPSKKHIVVCGHVSHETISVFLQDFLHPKRCENNPFVVILNKNKPDTELKTIILKYKTKVQYIRGCVMDQSDLENVGIHEVDAFILLANTENKDPDAEDSANILRVVAIKNVRRDTRVIVQILLPKNKSFLFNIPSWNWDLDDAVCMSEFELAVIAQSCLGNGFSTLMTNLLEVQPDPKVKYEEQWQVEYARGLSMDIYTDVLPNSMTNLTFSQAAQICYLELGVLLIAIRSCEANSIFIYDLETKVEDGSIGLFISESKDNVRNIFYLCQKKLRNLQGTIARGTCSNTNTNHGGSSSVESSPVLSPRESFGITNSREFNVDSEVSVKSMASTDIWKIFQRDLRNSRPSPSTIKCQTDYTRKFHWVDDQQFNACLFNSQEVEQISDHIIVCVTADSNDPLLGLGSLVMPLRTNHIPFNRLKHILFLGNKSYLKREWESLRNFPKISIFPCSTITKHNLMLAKISLCHRCILMSSKVHEDDDMEVILCALNIKTITNGVRSIRAGCTEDFIPFITRLTNSSCINFVDNFGVKVKEVYMRPAYAGGWTVTTFNSSQMCCSFYNREALAFFRYLITGGSCFNLEMLLAEGRGMLKGDDEATFDDRCFVSQLRVDKNAALGSTYGEFFYNCITKRNVLCIGLHRRINHDSKTTYVVTNPPRETPLNLTDTVLIIGKAGFVKLE